MGREAGVAARPSPEEEAVSLGSAHRRHRRAPGWVPGPAAAWGAAAPPRRSGQPALAAGALLPRRAAVRYSAQGRAGFLNPAG